MTPDELFEIWAPADARWSPWVKPVLFAWIAAAREEAPPEEVLEWRFEWLAPGAKDTALVVDAPGPESVVLGLGLAAQGFRPAPLFNALPSFAAAEALPEEPIPALVDVASIVRELRAASAELARMPLPPDAPPAFLLDSRRRLASIPMDQPYFDNRSLCFPTDFPSANFLLAHGIRRAVVLQWERDVLEADLARTLRGWAEGGVAVELKRLDLPGPPVPCAVPSVGFLKRIYWRIIESFGYHRNVLGGFGGVLSEDGAGG